MVPPQDRLESAPEETAQVNNSVSERVNICWNARVSTRPVAPDPSALVPPCFLPRRPARGVGAVAQSERHVRRWEGGNLQWEAEVSDATPSAEASDSKDSQIDWPLLSPLRPCG